MKGIVGNLAWRPNSIINSRLNGGVANYLISQLSSASERRHSVRLYRLASTFDVSPAAIVSIGPFIRCTLLALVAPMRIDFRN